MRSRCSSGQIEGNVRCRVRPGNAWASTLPGVREVVYGRSLPLATSNLQIVAATTGVQAGVIGAATMVIQHALTADRVDLAIASQSAS